MDTKEQKRIDAVMKKSRPERRVEYDKLKDPESRAYMRKVSEARRGILRRENGRPVYSEDEYDRQIKDLSDKLVLLAERKKRITAKIADVKARKKQDHGE